MGETDERVVDLTWVLPTAIITLISLPIMWALTPMISWLLVIGTYAIAGFFNPEIIMPVIPAPGAPAPETPMETV